MMGEVSVPGAARAGVWGGGHGCGVRDGHGLGRPRLAARRCCWSSLALGPAQGGSGAGSALIRLKAATSAWAQCQERSSRSLTLRPERAIRPAWWNSR